jgi:hypothetical protein
MERKGRKEGWGGGRGHLKENEIISGTDHYCLSNDFPTEVAQ